MDISGHSFVGKLANIECGSKQMNKIVRIAAMAAIAMTAAEQSFAQSASQDVNISATVPAFCSVTPATLSATVPVNAATGAVNTTAIAVTTASTGPVVTCNTAANVKAASVSGGVKNATTAPSGFSNVINYTGTATLGSTVATIDTSATAGAAGLEEGTAVSTGAAVSAGLAITVTPQASTSPLIPGSYSDILRVTITPQ